MTITLKEYAQNTELLKLNILVQSIVTYQILWQEQVMKLRALGMTQEEFAASSSLDKETVKFLKDELGYCIELVYSPSGILNLDTDATLIDATHGLERNAKTPLDYKHLCDNIRTMYVSLVNANPTLKYVISSCLYQVIEGGTDAEQIIKQATN